MEVIERDQRLDSLGEADFNAILDNDVFSTPSMEHFNMESDNWFDSLFEDPVLNDKMMTEAADPPHIKSEHSYSMANGFCLNAGSPGSMTKIEDMDSDDFLTPATTCDSTQMTVTTAPVVQIKTEPLIMNTQCCIKQPTIVLATTRTVTSSTTTKERLVLPKVEIKVEPQDMFSEESIGSPDSDMQFDNISLPPTPPSSSGSDSDGCQSPGRSPPSSPLRQLSASRQEAKSLSATSLSNQAAIYSQPIPQSGILILTEEEKRTLISEGYPLPSKLPLTKQEEKNLKKVRRKIKNKISAQESRRKKKEYLECLEKRVEQFSSENNNLKKKVDNLESNNKSLMSQLHKLQALVNRCPRPSAGATQASTCLMVMVLCFAVFIGSWTPTSFNIGYASKTSPAVVKQMHSSMDVMGPAVQDVKVDAYSTPNMRSRVLLSLKDEFDDHSTFYEPYGPHPPFGMDVAEAKDKMEDSVIVVKADPVTMEMKAAASNKTAEYLHVDQALMHPDIAADMPQNLNLTAKLVEAAVNATA